MLLVLPGHLAVFSRQLPFVSLIYTIVAFVMFQTLLLVENVYYGIFLKTLKASRLQSIFFGLFSLVFFPRSSNLRFGFCDNVNFWIF